MTKAEFLLHLDNFSAFWLTLYGECRGEPIDSQIAHACVIRNRAIARNQDFKTICLARLQFSCWNEGDPNLAQMIDYVENPVINRPDEATVVQLKWIAEGVMAGRLKDITHGANHYMAEWLWRSSDAPTYKQDATGIIKFGNTVFFNCP